MKTTIYKLKKDVLWYKAGTEFYYGERFLIWDNQRTVDSLQEAIASHASDKGSEEFFDIEVVEG